jgi:hypothetical protein
MTDNKSKELRIGEPAADGWKYCGISEETGKPMFVSPKDVNPNNWREGDKGAKSLRSNGKKECRLPSSSELNMVFNARSKIGGFSGGSYWTSTVIEGETVQTQNFNTGEISPKSKGCGFLSTRLVRS